MNVYAVVQMIVVLAIVLVAAVYAFRRLAPRSAARVRAAIGRQMVQQSRPQWLQRMGARWADAPAAPVCECCSSCSGCDLGSPEPIRIQRTVRRPGVRP